MKNKWLTEKQLDEIEEKIEAVVAESVEFAENSPLPSPDEIYTDVYAEANYPFIMD